MIAPRWRKIFRDLWSNKTRSFLVTLSIAIGVAAIGMVTGTYSIITRELPEQFEAVVPANASFLLTPFNEDFVRVVRLIPGVKSAEGRFTTQVRMQISPTEWKILSLTAYPDFDNIQINKIFPEAGAWPPRDKELILERSALQMLGLKIGDQLVIRNPNGIQRTLKITGSAHDLNKPSASFTNQANGYISMRDLDWLGFASDYNELIMITNADDLTYRQIRQLTYSIEEKIEKSGKIVYSTSISQPNQHWFVPYLAPMSAILGILGAVVLLLSGFLIINTISALLSQQTRQIGIMKAIGATKIQILMMYMVYMLVVGITAFLLAVPLGWLGMRGSVGLISSYINFNVLHYRLPLNVIWLQGILSIALPILASTPPIFIASNVSVRQAIQDYGISQKIKAKTRLVDYLSSLKGISRPIILSLRNTFRKKSRLGLTLITLTLASAIFIAVMSVYSSLLRTLDEALNYYGFDLAIFFSREYRVEQIKDEVARVPGVAVVETWGISDARIIDADGSESGEMMLIAPPIGTQLINPSVISGRWLLPEDENAVVINTDVLSEKPHLKVGDDIELKINGLESNWTVIGITRSVMTGPWIFTNYPYYARRLGRYGLSSGAYISLDEHSVPNQIYIAQLLEEQMGNVGLRVSSIGKVFELRGSAISQFNVIFLFLMIMVVMLALVGGLGLMGTMSLNILDRTREIGVMRAIGASDGMVYQIVIVEGILIGLISWMIGCVLSYPLSIVLSNAVGNGFLKSPLIISYTVAGPIYWLITIVIISTLASLAPARNATKLAVREILAYE